MACAWNNRVPVPVAAIQPVDGDGCDSRVQELRRMVDRDDTHRRRRKAVVSLLVRKMLLQQHRPRRVIRGPASSRMFIGLGVFDFHKAQLRKAVNE